MTASTQILDMETRQIPLHLPLEDAPDLLEAGFEHFAGGGDAHQSQGGALPKILVVDFRDGHVELAPDLILEAAQDLALLLEGMRADEVDFHHAKADVHGESGWG